MDKVKVVVIGFDGATWDLIRPWAEKGDLPTFKKLFKNGAWGKLKSTLPPVTFPAWKSFSTGKNPGKLGLFGHIQLENGKLRPCNAKSVKDNREMWDYLSNEDKKVAVIGVPITYPPKKVNGIMVSGPFSVGHNYTYPRELEKTLRKKYNYDPFPEEFLMSENRDIKILMESVKSKFDLLDDILCEDYDMVCSVIFETDTAQHFLWGTKGLKDLWKHIDKRLEKIVKKIDHDENTVLFMCSDHGFHKMKGAFYVNEWLRKKGYLKLHPRFKFLKMMSRFGITRSRIYRLMKKFGLLSLGRKIFSPEFQRKIGKTLPTDKKMISDQGIGAVANIGESKAFFVEGGVYVRDKEMIGKLYEEMNRLKDNMGVRFLDMNKKTSEYWGDHTEKAPDLLIWSDTYSLRGQVSLDRSKHIDYTSKNDKWVATHHRNGIFLAYGAGIKRAFKIDASIYDIAPTVLSIFSIKPDSDIDGIVLENIFES